MLNRIFPKKDQRIADVIGLVDRNGDLFHHFRFGLWTNAWRRFNEYYWHVSLSLLTRLVCHRFSDSLRVEVSDQLSDLDQVPVRVTEVAADLGFTVNWRRK